MIKRLFDIFISLIAIVVLIIPFLGTYLLVKIKLGSPVFFCQVRPGRNGRSFVLYKFRSMGDARGANGQMLTDDERLTQFGCWIRSTSLDELPALWNVLKGDMSLVGPRPLLMEYLPLYTMEQSRRHSIRPGITGWAQVNGRNSINWEDKFKLDVWYVDHCSLLLDIKILYLTLKKVIMREGISAEGTATMPKFTGIVDKNKKP